MPGNLLKLHIVFKSIKGGIFSEKWEFVTQPRLLNSASLVLTLRGVAIQEDRYKKTRASIEVLFKNPLLGIWKNSNKKSYFDQINRKMIAKSIIDLVLSGVQTPERSPTPMDLYITEEDTFKNLNPDVNWNI